MTRRSKGKLVAAPLAGILLVLWAYNAAVMREGCGAIADLSELIDIHLSLTEFSMSHDDRFPDTLLDLYPDYYQDKEALQSYLYVPGHTINDDPDAVLFWDPRYYYHKCADTTQVRIMHRLGNPEIINMGKKNYYDGRLRTLLFWRFAGYPYESKTPALSDILAATNTPST